MTASDTTGRLDVAALRQYNAAYQRAFDGAAELGMCVSGGEKIVRDDGTLDGVTYLPDASFMHLIALARQAAALREALQVWDAACVAYERASRAMCDWPDYQDTAGYVATIEACRDAIGKRDKAVEGLSAALRAGDEGASSPTADR